MSFTKYSRIAMKALKSSFLTTWEYKTDFYASIIIQIVYFAMMFLFFNIIFGYISALAGWKLGEIMLLIFMNDIGLSIFSATGLRYYSEYIITGQLNTKLLKPANTLFLIAVEHIVMAEILFAIMDIIFAIIAVFVFNLPITFWSCTLGIFQFIISFPLLIFPYLLINTLAFFIGDTEGLHSIYNSLIFSTREYPMSIFNKIFLIFFSIIAPGTLLHLFFPTAIMLNKISTFWIIGGIALTIILDIITLSLFYWLFKKGLKKYEGVG